MINFLPLPKILRKIHTSLQIARNAIMGYQILQPNSPKMHANFRLCNVSGCTTEILEIRAREPSLHVLFIPGNPGVVTFYKDFVEKLYELLGGTASITAVGHISHTKKNWEHGSLFSLQEQIHHKVQFIKDELGKIEVPTVLVGHSIGSYIAIETFKSFKQVMYCIGLYPFLALNTESKKQFMIGKIASSPFICALLSSITAGVGILPSRASRFILRKTLGKLWCQSAVEATCTHLLKYHVIRNVLFMALTEFERLSEAPDWEFMRGNSDRVAFLFGIDDHWGPLTLFEEISKQVPDVALSIEEEGHTHGFCCTEAGSFWVAEHVANLIKPRLAVESQ